MRRLAPTLALLLAAGAALAPRPAAAATSQVFGYLPYWQLDADRSDWRWDRLTTLAYFSAELAANGTVTAWHGFDGADGAAIVAEAHGHGVRVVLVATAFSSTIIHGVVTTGKATAIDALVDAVVAAGADGINLDFEGMAAADRDALTAFTSELRTSLRAAIPDATISLAMPAVDWSNAYDEAALAEIADQLFIMAYDYHWRGGAPGPVAPLETSDRWGNYNVRVTFEGLVDLVGEAYRDRLVLGAPLYGYDWPTTSATVPGTRRANATAVLWAAAQTAAATHGRQWDEASQTPYYVYEADDGWHQVFYEDAESLAAKLSLAEELELGGVGMWALGYESATFWTTLDAFGPVEPPDDGPQPVGPGWPLEPTDPVDPGGSGDGMVDGGCAITAGTGTARDTNSAAWLSSLALVVLGALGRGARRRAATRRSRS